MDDELRTPFEERLQAIAPAAPREALRGRIAEQLGPRRATRRPYAFALAGLAAAACVAVGLGAWIAVSSIGTLETPDTPGRVVDTPVDAPALDTAPPRPNPELHVEADAPARSLLAYQRAMRQAPETVIFVIDRQAAFSGDGVTPQTYPPDPLRAMDAAIFLNDNERCDG